MTEADVTHHLTPRNRNRARAAVLILPAAIVVGFVVVGSLGTLVAQSAGLLPFVGEPRLSVDAYFANAAELPSAIGISLAVSAVATFLAVGVGFMAAVVIWPVSFMFRARIGRPSSAAPGGARPFSNMGGKSPRSLPSSSWEPSPVR